MKMLGIDYGDSRIGLSVSDALGITAQPLKHLEVNNGWKNIVPVIHNIIKEKNINKIVIGYPLELNGEKGERCTVTDNFISVLKKGIEDIEIVKWDERMTTKAAEHVLIQSAKKKDRNKKKGNHDIIAAVVILQSYLDYLKNSE